MSSRGDILDPQPGPVAPAAHVAVGRWLSPTRGASAQLRALGWEPAGLGAVNPANPRLRGISAGNPAKQMPAYAHVGNQPLSATDPTGLDGSGGGQTIGGGNALTPAAQCEVEGLPDDCWWTPLLDDLCGSGSPWEQLDPSCRQFATPAPSEGGGGQGAQGTIVSNSTQITSRLRCAAAYGQNHSVASWFGAQSTWWGRALGGNIFSTATDAAIALTTRGAPAAGLVASRYAGQVVVVGTGGALGGAVGGAGPVAGAVSSLTMGSVTVPGAGPGLTSLGITSSGEIAVQDGAALTVQAAGAAARWATGIAAAKLVLDFATFAYGAVAACQ